LILCDILSSARTQDLPDSSISVDPIPHHELISSAKGQVGYGGICLQRSNLHTAPVSVAPAHRQ
ncbi:MAG: hypothetical protein ACYDAP_04935, partial [Thermoplasmataceae archaeon]